MSDDTPITTEMEAKAQAGTVAERAWLNDPKSSNNPVERERHSNQLYTHLEVVGRAKSQREASRQQASDAERLERLTNPDTPESRIRSAIARHEAEAEKLPENHPRRQELYEDVAFLRHKLAPAPRPAITDDDHRHAMATGGLSDRTEQDAVLEALNEFKLSGPEKLRVAFAIQHSQPEQLDEEQMKARLQGLWGDEYETNYATAQSVWEALPYEARVVLTPRRGSPDVLKALLDLARGR